MTFLGDMDKQILLSFDIEEFDIPEEYGQKVDKKTKIETTREGLKEILRLLDELNIKATFFTTAHFALNNKLLIKKISRKHEIASHSFYHSSFKKDDLEKSRKELEKITGSKVLGFRMPRLEEIDEDAIRKAGYKYNSSINPTFIPGRYNNFFRKRTPYFSSGLLNIPVSVVPGIRFPVGSWLSFKNFPLSISKFASLINLKYDGFVNLYLHPWEFADISGYNLPFYVKGKCGKVLWKKLFEHLKWLKGRGEFITFSEFSDRLSSVK